MLNMSLVWVVKQASVAVPHRKNYAGFETTVGIRITRNNQSLDHASWNETRYNGWVGVVALDHSFIESHNLLPAQEYPWNASRSIYFLQGFHSMHCVQMLRRAILETKHGKPWSAEFGHLEHCLNVLREDIECYADDFPRYTGALNDQAGEHSSASGLGSIRQCRDWSKLHRFAIDNSACFKPVPPFPSTLEQYKFCPDGSEPWLAFGY